MSKGDGEDMLDIYITRCCYMGQLKQSVQISGSGGLIATASASILPLDIWLQSGGFEFWFKGRSQAVNSGYLQ